MNQEWQDELIDLYIKMIAMSLAVDVVEYGTYTYYKSIFDEVDKRQTSWGKVMSDIATQQLTEEGEHGSKT